MAKKRRKTSKKTRRSRVPKVARVTHRNTQQRQMMLQLLTISNAHPSVSWIHQRLKRKFRGVTLGRVHRNLRILKEEGKVWELDFFGTGVSCFAAVKHSHYHFVCNGCKKIYDIRIPPIKEVEDRISQLTGFRILSHRLEFFGLCDRCKLKKQVHKVNNKTK